MNFIVNIPIHQFGPDQIGDTFMQHMFSKYSVPECIIIDHDSTFTSTLINFLFKRLGIRSKTVAPNNCQYLKDRT